jgi:nitrate reductase alpha subunit
MPKFFSKVEKFNGSFSQLEENNRRWESIYRKRWAHDKVIRTTHGVNCTGSCSWNVYVKEGLVTWEHQATDYPACGPDVPDYEPRGCPRGASFSWYEYSPLRIKYPYIRGVLWNLWTEARKAHPDSDVEAWKSIVEDEAKARQYKSARGHGGLVRVKWDDALEMISAQLAYTIKKYGPDRIAGFSPIPAMSMISFSSGTRFLSLLGSELLSFYDWNADLPPASPQVWGEQTDVPESADWWNSQYMLLWGSNVPMTRTPDAHFMTESRYKGTKVVTIAPDYSEAVKFADNWLAPHPGSDAALAQGMTHVILNEYYVKQQTPAFEAYAKQYTDLPFVLMLKKQGENFIPGRFLRESDLTGKTEKNAEWKPVVFDNSSKSYKAPNGTVGQRWEEGVKWNLQLDGIDPALHTEGGSSVTIDFPFFDKTGASVLTRHIPAKTVTLATGEEVETVTVLDLMLAQYGLTANDDLGAKGYDDADSAYTPAWQEKETGVKASLVIQIAQEFAQNALETGGKSMVLMGAGINHWFNSDNIYRSILNLVILTGCEGVNGGGWAHYVGQEKLRPKEGWSTIAFANDWTKGQVRHQNGTSFFYWASDQWKFDELDNEAQKSPLAHFENPENSYKHPADYNQMAIRLGWLPSYPQFDRNNLDFTKQYGTTDSAEVAKKVAEELKAGTLHFAAEDPDAAINQPKALFVWRSNFLTTYGKGQEYMMKYLWGTENGLMSKTNDAFKPETMTWRDDEENPIGKLDMVVTLDFRMVTTPLYSDIVLPAATWYEKEDLSSTDLHPFIHPFNAAVQPLWESQTDWQIFRRLAEKFQNLAKTEFPEPIYDVHTSPIGHDTPGELSQPFGVIKDWKKGEVDAIPGKTLPTIKVVERDYTKIYDKFVTLGPNLENGAVGADGLSYPIGEQYNELKDMLGTNEAGLPSIYDEKKVADAILTLSSTSNGKVAMKAWEALEEETGQKFTDIGEAYKHQKMTFKNITVQPAKSYPTPANTSLNAGDEAYSPFTIQKQRLAPWHTLTGRQHFYIDHEIFAEYGEQLPTYKPTLPPQVMGPKDVELKPAVGEEVTLRYMTPHGKWSLHSMYGDTPNMLTLFRGGPVVWMSNVDAEKAGIQDNDWVEVYNRNGVMTCRAVVSHRMPEGTLFSHHAQDMTFNSPLSNITGNRGASSNAPTQIHIKPTQMVGGYAQFTYAWNYYGPVGNNRDLYCKVRKIEQLNWYDEVEAGKKVTNAFGTLKEKGAAE